MSLEGTGKVAQKQKKSVKKKFKAFMKTQVFVRGRRAKQEEMLNRFWWMTAWTFFFLLSPLSMPLDRELNGSLWAAAVGLQGSLGAWVVVCFAWACPSALVSVVVVHGGRDAGDYRGASPCCKVTCDSWTYRWERGGDHWRKLGSGGRTGLFMMIYTRKWCGQNCYVQWWMTGKSNVDDHCSLCWTDNAPFYINIHAFGHFLI